MPTRISKNGYGSAAGRIAIEHLKQAHTGGISALGTGRVKRFGIRHGIGSLPLAKRDGAKVIEVSSQVW